MRDAVPPSRAGRLSTLCLLLALLVAGLFATSAQAASSNARPFKVMTRNLYLGADLTPATQATTVPELLAADAQIFANVQQTNFPARAKALAREIQNADPTLVGLQEVTTWYSGPEFDPAPATHVEYDWLKSLRHELAALGDRYDVVKAQQEADLESPAGDPYNEDIRVSLRDVILVKHGANAQLTNARSANYQHVLTFTAGLGQTITVERGWVSVDATVNKRSARFVTTHLESAHPGIRAQQAGELVDPSGPVGSAPGKVILVGDMNSDPNQPSPDNLAYNTLIGAGLTDTWLVANPTDPGLTCCFSELLDDPSPVGVFDQRIDHVLTKGSVGVVKSRIYGTDPNNRAAGPLWPSDHAGVAATLTP